jgi:hypothetical protein
MPGGAETGRPDPAGGALVGAVPAGGGPAGGPSGGAEVGATIGWVASEGWPGGLPKNG